MQLRHRLEMELAQESSIVTQPVGEVQPRPQCPNTEGSEVATPKLLILIVDDNAINRTVNSHILKKLGYEIVLACDGQESLDYLCRTAGKPCPAMVFMDYRMPIIDGCEATRRIRNDVEMFDEQTRTLPIVGLTASALERDRVRCFDASMNDCIGPLVTRRELEAAVLKWTSLESTGS